MLGYRDFFPPLETNGLGKTQHGFALSFNLMIMTMKDNLMERLNGVYKWIDKGGDGEKPGFLYAKCVY